MEINTREGGHSYGVVLGVCGLNHKLHSHRMSNLIAELT